MNKEDVNKKVLGKLGFKITENYDEGGFLSSYTVTYPDGSVRYFESFATEFLEKSILDYTESINLALTLIKDLDFYLVGDEGGFNLRIYVESMSFGYNDPTSAEGLAERICRTWLMYKAYVGDANE